MFSVVFYFILFVFHGWITVESCLMFNFTCFLFIFVNNELFNTFADSTALNNDFFGMECLISSAKLLDNSRINY